MSAHAAIGSMPLVSASIVGLVLGLGCSSQTTFACTNDEQCVSGNVAGTCEESGYCSFPDDSCPSEQRYGEFAGEGLAGACVPVAEGCMTGPDPCCESDDPCCGSDDPCCGSDDPCCGSDDPCCGSDDPCCGGCTLAFRQPLVFDNTASSEDLVEFPVLVLLSPAVTDYAAFEPDGRDLRFVDPDGQPLPHEIEQWNAGGDSVVWVRVPQIDAGSADDFIWMHYGDSQAPGGQAPGEVWSNHQAVYHLHESVDDSSGSELHGVDLGTTMLAGAVGGARGFDGQGAFIDLGANRDFVRDATGVTLSAWIRPITGFQPRTVVFATSIEADATTSSRTELSLEADLVIVGGARALDSQLQLAYATGPSLLAAAWSHVTFVVDYPADTLQLYVDGELAAVNRSAGFEAMACERTPNGRTVIGTDEPAMGFFFNGGVDELRLALFARSSDWIRAQYRSMTGAFVGFGEPEPLAE